MSSGHFTHTSNMGLGPGRSFVFLGVGSIPVVGRAFLKTGMQETSANENFMKLGLYSCKPSCEKWREIGREKSRALSSLVPEE